MTDNPYLIGAVVLAIAAWFFFSIVSGVMGEKKRRKREEIARFNARMSKEILREEREKARASERL